MQNITHSYSKITAADRCFFPPQTAKVISSQCGRSFISVYVRLSSVRMQLYGPRNSFRSVITMSKTHEHMATWEYLDRTINRPVSSDMEMLSVREPQLHKHVYIKTCIMVCKYYEIALFSLYS